MQRLRNAIAGRANDDELEALVGFELQRFRDAGNFDAEKGSDAWRMVARALCSAEYEALERAYERDEGDYSGKPTNPLLENAEPAKEPKKRVSLKKLWADYLAMRQQTGSMLDGGPRQRVVIDNLRKFMRHDDAAKITKKDILEWRDHLMKTRSARTVSDVYLSTARSLFRWAVENDLLEENPVLTVKQPKPRQVFKRERGYTDEEALKVIKAARKYEPTADKNGYIREKQNLVDANRWVPLICAFTGARVTEITQLRKRDVQQIDGMWVIRITPDAGTVKSGGYRDVPLHPQLIEEGFDEFWKAAPDGPLFHNGKKQSDYVRKSRQIAGQIGDWLRETGLRPEGLAPNHAWRHRFKTKCMELAISDRVMDAIQGHAGRTAGDNYGDVTLKAKRAAIEQLPNFPIN